MNSQHIHLLTKHIGETPGKELNAIRFNHTKYQYCQISPSVILLRIMTNARNSKANEKKMFYHSFKQDKENLCV